MGFNPVFFVQNSLWKPYEIAKRVLNRKHWVRWRHVCRVQRRRRGVASYCGRRGRRAELSTYKGKFEMLFEMTEK